MTGQFAAPWARTSGPLDSRRAAMTDRIPVRSAQRWLVSVWGIGAAIVLAVLFLQTIGGRNGNESQKAWSWFMPTVLPTLTLMAGARLRDATSGQQHAWPEAQGVQLVWHYLAHDLELRSERTPE
jgi:hypothetical protein